MGRKAVVYIATSVDGYIAGPGEDMSFLSVAEKPGEDYGYGSFIATIDTVILGRKTYDWVTKHAPSFAHSDKQTFVITRTPRPPVGSTSFYTGDVAQLLRRLVSEEGKDVFVDGGGETIHTLLEHELVDDLILSSLPILLGGGTRLFRDGRPAQHLELVGSKQFETGLVQTHYRCRR